MQITLLLMDLRVPSGFALKTLRRNFHTAEALFLSTFSTTLTERIETSSPDMHWLTNLSHLKYSPYQEEERQLAHTDACTVFTLGNS